MSVGKPMDRAGGDEQADGLRRASERLAAACRPCPERGGDLAVECLCPCPVAVARRFLATASDSGRDPGLLDTEPRGALRLQAWASSERPATCDLGVVQRGLRELVEVHSDCALPGCLACEARTRLEALLQEAEATLGHRV